MKTQSQTDVVFPKEVQEALFQHFNVSKEDTISEIYFATAATNKLTNKLTFTKIYYEVENSVDLEVYISNTFFCIELGAYEVRINFKTPLDFDNDNDIIINKESDFIVI